MIKTVIRAMNCAADAQRSGRDKSGPYLIRNELRYNIVISAYN